MESFLKVLTLQSHCTLVWGAIYLYFCLMTPGLAVFHPCCHPFESVLQIFICVLRMKSSMSRTYCRLVQTALWTFSSTIVHLGQKLSWATSVPSVPTPNRSLCKMEQCLSALCLRDSRSLFHFLSIYLLFGILSTPFFFCNKCIWITGPLEVVFLFPTVASIIPWGMHSTFIIPST